MRPARDLGLPVAVRLRSSRRESGLAGWITGSLWRTGVSLYLAAAHRMIISGRENIPLVPPFIMVANHTSHLDALSLTAALPGALARRATALAAGDVFFRSLPGAAFAAAVLNALPIWRTRTSVADLELLRQRLSEDRLIFVLFPEGTRARDGVMATFRPGLGALVAGSSVPVLPCWMEGAHLCWPPQRLLPRPGQLRLKIGAPLDFNAIANDRAGWQHVAFTTEAAVRRLAGFQSGLDAA